MLLSFFKKASNPAELYIFPVQELNKPVLQKSAFGKYRKKVDSVLFLTKSRIY